MENNRDTTAYPSEGYAWYVVAVFMLAYTFSYVDRTILTLLVQPVRNSLGITDVEISLLHGLAFAVFYTLPWDSARLARGSRQAHAHHRRRHSGMERDDGLLRSCP